MIGFNEIYPKLLAENPMLQWIHDPVVEDKAPEEEWFDKLVTTLKDEPASTQCIFSCQMGRGRTTLGKRKIIPVYLCVCLLVIEFIVLKLRHT